MRERTIEQHLVCQVERFGGLTFKFLSTQAGVPDRIVIFRGITYFIELKAPGGKLTKIQIWQHERIKKAGVLPLVFYSKLDVERWLTSIVDL